MLYCVQINKKKSKVIPTNKLTTDESFKNSIQSLQSGWPSCNPEISTTKSFLHPSFEHWGFARSIEELLLTCLIDRNFWRIMCTYEKKTLTFVLWWLKSVLKWLNVSSLTDREMINRPLVAHRTERIRMEKFSMQQQRDATLLMIVRLRCTQRAGIQMINLWVILILSYSTPFHSKFCDFV